MAVASTLFASCNMDLAPIGSLDDENALLSLNDVYRFRNGFYTGFRSFSSSDFFSYADLQCDQFNGLVINGNRGGSVANGTILPGEDYVSSYWLTCYSRIANINYFLEKSEPLYQAAKENSDDEIAIVSYERFIAEAYFFRAYYYAMMFDRYCTLYSADKANQEGLGLPIVTVYLPTSDRSKYPGRSSMQETLDFIQQDLDKALSGLQEYEAFCEANGGDGDGITLPMSNYASSWAVKALKARIAMWIGDNATALEVSKDIIENGNYTLTKFADYAKMWTDDASTEIILMPYYAANELSNSIGSTWISIYSDQADYIPSSTVIEQLEAAGGSLLTGKNDVRYGAFLDYRDLNVNAQTVKTLCFYKFPGNKALQTGNVNLMNAPKPFRLSESYLIAAEAAAALNDNATANNMLNAYLQQRIRNYQDQNLSGNELTNEIRLQRGLELIGEGFRLSDLRRWKQGFSRNNGGNYADTPDVDGILTPMGLTVSYVGDDYRYTWPIPTDEIQSNPQMAGQQNPGY